MAKNYSQGSSLLSSKDFSELKSKDHNLMIESFLMEIKDKSKLSDEGRRKKAICTLQQNLYQEMPEMSDEERKHFYDTALNTIFDLMVKNAANNPADIKSGIMLMCILLDAPKSEKNKPSILAPFANHLRNVNLSLGDLELIDLIACAVGKIALNSGSSTQDFVYFEISRAIEIICNDRNDISKRHSAILNLRELANVTSSYFFSHVMLIFENIFFAIYESKLREAAISALRSALLVVVERERLASISSQSSKTATRIDQQIPLCFEICYNKVIEGLNDREKLTKDHDDRIHATLLILNELFRCSHDPSVILRDSISRELDFSYINLNDFNDVNTFYLSNYLFSQFDYPVSISSSVNTSLGTNTPVPFISNSGVIPSNTTYKSYLTKLFRNHTNVESQNVPLYGLRDLHSVVNYHKEMGIAPILYFFQKSKPSSLSSSCKQLIMKNYGQICSNIINLMRMKNSIQINQVILLILPSLTSLNPQQFSDLNYVNEAIQYLLNCVRNPTLKPLAFISLGLFALAIKDVNANRLDDHLSTIINQIRQSFSGRDNSSSKKRISSPNPAVFTCLAFLTQAVGPKIKSDILEMLPSMFSIGLTEPLANSLYDICKYIPDLKANIHEGLLKILSQIIINRQTIASKTVIEPSLLTSNETINDLTSLRLALKVLGRFDFQSQYLIRFVGHCANYYLSHENREIRLEAVHTCCHLLKPFLKPGNSVENITKSVLNKLLLVGITDCDKYVRYSVLSRLDDQFDYYLAQADNLESLQVCIYDEVFEIRELGICIIGRLCSLNPAYVMPFLRKVLLQLLTELEISRMGKNMEQSARMLGHLLAATPRLVRPYTEPILKVFLPMLTNPSLSVSTAVMSAIGEQAIVSGLEMRSWFEDLFPIFLEAVQDTSSFQKREVALWTMGRLIENCGIVSKPYWDYPNLLDVLFGILKSESTKSSQLIRRETIRVLGLLGAVDPYKRKIRLGMIDLSGESLISFDPDIEQELIVHDVLSNLSNSFDDFYSEGAISTLMRVMKDPCSSTQHTMAVQAVAFIFNVLQMRSVPYIQHILPPFINIIRSGEPRIKEFLLQQLGQIISVVKKHIRSYLDDIFKVLRELWWNTNSSMQMTLFNVVDQIVVALGGEFRDYVPHLIPHILKVLNHDFSSRKEVTLKLLGALQNFGTNLEDYIHLLIPPIVRLFETPTTSSSNQSDLKRETDIKIAALKTIESFCDDLLLTEFSSRIIHGIIKTIDHNAQDKALTSAAMDTLIKFIFQLGPRYKMYIPLTNKILLKHRIQYASYEQLIVKLTNSSDIDDLQYDNIYMSHKTNIRKIRETRDQQQQSLTGSDGKRNTVTLEEIQRAWDQCPRRISKEDWLEWLRKFNIDLIKESPSLSIRSCFPIAQASNSVARDLFNSAFLSCFNELALEQQKQLVFCLQEAMKEQEVPEVTGILLNLAEFMEHIDQGPLLFDSRILAERAMKCRAYAKALHYKEKEFVEPITNEVLGTLITINNKLQQPQAAIGCLMYAMKSPKFNDIDVKEKWLEKLNNWESAFIFYKLRYEQDNSDFESIVGQMRCLEVLSEWEKLYNLAQNTFPDASEANKQRMARMVVNSTWGLNKWDEMINYSQYISKDSSDSAFYEAVIKIHENDFIKAQFYIDKARQLIDNELTTMIGESYNRAYPAMVHIQLMSELEEVIQYKLVPERREMIKQKWWQRLQDCQKMVEDWQKLLQVHSLVLSPLEDKRALLKFVKLCERNNRPDLSLKTIIQLMGCNPARLFKRRQPLPIIYPEVTFKFIDHIWISGHFKRAFIELHKFIKALENPQLLQDAEFNIFYSTDMKPVGKLNEEDMPYANANVESTLNKSSLNKILSRAHLQMAQWQEFLVGFSEESIPTILHSYQQAKERDQKWYKAWHSWASMNFRALKYCKEKHPALCKNLDYLLHPNANLEPGSERLSPKDYAINAVHGFFKSVILSKNGSSLQDTLRILTLWFEDGYDNLVRIAVEDGIKNVPIVTWLQVIPQLIARIDMPNSLVAKLIHQLLTDIGKFHPQALIYPLTVASKSSAQLRSESATKILQSMRVDSSDLVSQAVVVSEELIRIAILWHELWHEGLEEASRLYFGDTNVEAMFDTLEPLHSMIECKAVTFNEITFFQNYGFDLSRAKEYCNKYKETKDQKHLTQAWEIYYHVFRKITRQLPNLTSLELQYVSPKLTHLVDLELAVPGSYNPNQEFIYIAKVEPQISIITSKQRPRKLTIKGSNGRNYMFLLKGHEDLRQDERVMQLFGLVNTLLNSEISTSQQNLAIQRYAVIPLSPNSGLIGWVPHCDTLHALIRDYRDKRKILLNMEHRLMLRMAPDYDRLTLLQKVEVFEHALEHTPGDDLAKILWLKSPSSEVWFDRRTNYTRSLAVMSMVGYILGLGDRHPSNLMLSRMSGKILHIDFGDCFEVAMTREKYPEKIPFRLTRMLIKAMEVTGLDGTFRITCHGVMFVLRKNKESLMALLEAFVYDPLLNWRLMEAQPNKIKLENNDMSIHPENDLDTGTENNFIVNSLPQSSIKKLIPLKIMDRMVETKNEKLNYKAVVVINRVRDKLTGRDFDSSSKSLGISQQVDLLISQATSHENLCQCYIGWCPFW